MIWNLVARWVTGGTTWSLVCKVSLVSISFVKLTDIHLVQPERGTNREKRVLIGKHQKVNSNISKANQPNQKSFEIWTDPNEGSSNPEGFYDRICSLRSIVIGNFHIDSNDGVGTQFYT